MNQKLNSNNLRVHGITETEGEDTDKLVIKTFKENLDIDINPLEISTTHRIGKPESENRPILVKLTRQNTRTKIFKAKKELRNKENKIFINEDLTPNIASFFKKVRDLKKDKLIKRTWTVNGKVYYIPNNANQDDKPKLIEKDTEEIRKASSENQ